MKKLLKSVLCFGLVFSLCACSDNNETPVKDTVNNYFSSLEKGDLSTAYTYVSSDTSTDFSALKDSQDSLDEMLDEYQVSDNTKKLFSDVFASIIKLCIQSHSVKSVEKVSDTEYTVLAEASILDSDSINDAIENVNYDSFIEGISDEVTKKYTDEGEAAAMEYMMASMADWLSQNYTSALSALTPSSQNLSITVDKVDDAWLITGMSDQ